jgi:hypothetical protein
MSEERRQAERYAAHLGTEITFADGKQATGITVDASDSGLLILTAATPEVGAKLQLRIRSLDEGHAPYDAEGEVARTEPVDSYGSLWRARLAIRLAQTPEGLHDEIARANERHRQWYDEGK